MDAKTLETICDQVYHKFPEVKGIRPKLQPLSKGKTSQHILVFTSHATTTNGTSMNRVVRVVVSEAGQIIKMSTSK